MTDKIPTERNSALRRRLYGRLRERLLSGRGRTGLLTGLVTYVLLIGLGFVFLYPVLYMLVNSFMSTSDLVDPTVAWIPSGLHLENYERAYNVLDYPLSLLRSVFMSAVPAVIQTLSLSFIAYGLARFRMPGKKCWIVLLIAAYIIPSQVTLVPQYVLFQSYGLIGSPLVSFLPALLGQGIKSSLFILVFFQFYSAYPVAFDEAAAIDGAGVLRRFVKIALPMAGPAVLVTFLFTFIWSWNETVKSGMFFGAQIPTLPMKLQHFVDAYSQMYATSDFSTANKLNEAIRLAGTLLTIAPLIALYVFLQRYFIEGIERSGITGE